MLRIHGNKFKHLAGLSYAGLAGSSAAFLLILAAMLFAPAASQPEASAVEDNSGISTYAATPTVGISLPTSIDFADVLPTPSGATTTATADLTITTTDSAGYSLYLYSSDGDNSLKPKISSLANISTINATAGDVGLTLSSLKPNTWGYNLGTEAPTDTTTYSAVPTNDSTPIQTKDTSDTNSANDTYTLSFGAKVDTTAASGAYSDTLTIAVVAEPRKMIFDGIQTMQEMTSTICADATENETARLTDIRDGKQYWVAKLADGNCWMTQNLDLDLTNDIPLTPEDSDVSSNWYPPNATENGTTASSVTDEPATYSWDFGLWVKDNPSNYDSYCSEVTTMDDCDGWTNVADLIPSTTEWNGAASNTINSGNGTYDAHFLVGNYYAWDAATAGTGGDITDTEASDSICPKGWHLPTTNDTYSGSFFGLVGAVNSTAITQNPYYFVPSGSVYVVGSQYTLMMAGSQGYYWSSTAYNHHASAVSLYFNDSMIVATNPNPYTRAPEMYINTAWRDNGLSIRCLANIK